MAEQYYQLLVDREDQYQVLEYVGLSGDKYCCLACSLNTNNSPYGPRVTHIALKDAVLERTVPSFFAGPSEIERETHYQVLRLVNAHTRRPNNVDIDESENLYRTLDVHCNRCHNKLGKLFTDRMGSRCVCDSPGDVYRLYIVDRAKVILIN